MESAFSIASRPEHLCGAGDDLAPRSLLLSSTRSRGGGWTRHAHDREARSERRRFDRVRELHHPGELYQWGSGDPAGSRPSLDLHWNNHLGISGNDPRGITERTWWRWEDSTGDLGLGTRSVP